MAVIYIGRTLSAAQDSVTADQGAAGVSPWVVRDLAKLVPFAFDHVSLGYNAQSRLQTVIYRTGGVGGTIVATLTLSYVNGLLATVARS
jgi:hypothetical protein